MIKRVLLAALAAVLFVATSAYMLGSLNEKSFMLAEAGRDACYAHHGIDPMRAASVPEATRIECTKPIRNYEHGQIWRALFAAAAGATMALLVAGGIAIVLRSRRPQETGGPPDALTP